MTVYTYTHDEPTAARVLAAMADRGYLIGPGQQVVRTVLDTFDGRVHARGLRLEAQQAPDLSIVVAGVGTVPARAEVERVPVLAADLPAGPLRARLAPVIGIRALLPRLSMTGRRTRVLGRDSSGRTVVEAAVYERLEVAGARGVVPACTVEIHELAGYPKPAAALRRLHGDLGLRPLDHDTLDAGYLAAGVSRTGFDSTPTIPLAPELPALEGFAAVLQHLAGAIGANWNGTVADVDPEFLHDLRVASRRTRSVLSQARNVVPADVRDRFRAEFKWLGDATGLARDLDVYVIEWEGYVHPLGEAAPTLDPVLTELQDRRRGAYEVLAKTLKSQRAKRILPAWQGWLADPRSQHPAGKQSDRPLGDIVVRRIVGAQKLLVARGRSIHGDSPGFELHELRKDAKKLRYLLECFGGLLPAAPRKAFVQRLKALQDNLGEHQDADVHVEQLRALAPQMQGADTVLAMGQLVQHLDQRRQASRAEFADRFGSYDSKQTRRALREVLEAARR